MKATCWMLGCLLSAAIASPTLASGSTDDMGTQNVGQRSAGSSSRARTIDSSSNGGGDLVAPSTTRSSEAPVTANSENIDSTTTLPVSTGARQAPSSRSNVGWQSLLPGSIQ